jgi:hypothetical protein
LEGQHCRTPCDDAAVPPVFGASHTTVIAVVILVSPAASATCSIEAPPSWASTRSAAFSDASRSAPSRPDPTSRRRASGVGRRASG